ncbi:MAG TPA: cytochrome c-type biogenesis protein CcmH [Bryobacteraceae bacterium]|nr:cytochrome c-type biogenesis protein CcmH [Bryobacteraceae bacterium]
MATRPASEARLFSPTLPPGTVPRSSRRQALQTILLAVVLAVAALAQTASEKPSVDVRRVGSRLACQCGCKDSVATCSMLECHFSKPAKERIAQMQAVGMSDDQIIQAFVRDYGAGIFLAQPNAWGWIVPYVSVGLGLVVIWMFIKKYRKPAPMAEIGPMELDDPDLAKYKDQIEKDLANLE